MEGTGFVGSAVINEAKRRQNYDIVSISRRGKVEDGSNDVTWVITDTMYIYIYIFLYSSTISFNSFVLVLFPTVGEGRCC